MDWLPRNVPENDDLAAIVHGDFRLDNVIFGSDVETSPRVAAVLDWELSSLGHPLTDLAYLCMPYHLPPIPGSPVHGLADLDLKAAGIPSEQELLEMYTQAACMARSGQPNTRGGICLTSSGIPCHWQFFLALSFFRAASILQGVYKRALQGNASAANAEAVGKFASKLAEIGWSCAQKHTVTDRHFMPSPTPSPSIRAHKHEHLALSAAPWPLFAPPSETAQRLLREVTEFVQEEVLPLESAILRHQYTSTQRWTSIAPELEQLKASAKAAGLWNLFLPLSSDPEQK